MAVLLKNARHCVAVDLSATKSPEKTEEYREMSVSRVSNVADIAEANVFPENSNS
jgi:hypothetical protein